MTLSTIEVFKHQVAVLDYNSGSVIFFSEVIPVTDGLEYRGRTYDSYESLLEHYGIDTNNSYYMTH